MVVLNFKKKFKIRSTLKLRALWLSMLKILPLDGFIAAPQFNGEGYSGIISPYMGDQWTKKQS
jgi:hypothetical protein